MANKDELLADPAPGIPTPVILLMLAAAMGWAAYTYEGAKKESLDKDE